jgi:type I restriction enzyme S subunit
MTPRELKNSILQLAIQGRLVEQRPEEGTAAELYSRMEACCYKSGKINQMIYDNEVPFDIPDSWIFVRIKNVAVLHNGRAYCQKELLDKGKYPVLRVGNLFTSNSWYYSDLELEEEKYCDYGDLLYAWSASFGPFIWKGNKVIYHYHIWRIDCSVCIDKEYLYYFLLADTENIKRSGHGLAMIHVTKAGTEERLLPLPPLAEQKRIVARIEELLPLVDRYEQAWNRLEDLNKRFPGDLQKSLLQLAIQGKLVEQRPEEGTGEDLFQQIQREKQSLIKAGKLKKEKPLPEITEDEIPFDIPESWKWVRLCQVGITQTGNTPSKTHPEYLGTDIPFISPGDIQHNTIFYGKQALSLLGKQVARVGCVGTILQVCIGGSIGKGAIADREVTFNQQINAITPIIVNSDYLLSVMTSHYFISSMKEKAGGTATPIINRGLWDSLLVPLPPINEQKRIISKLGLAVNNIFFSMIQSIA